MTFILDAFESTGRNMVAHCTYFGIRVDLTLFKVGITNQYWQTGVSEANLSNNWWSFDVYAYANEESRYNAPICIEYVFPVNGCLASVYFNLRKCKRFFDIFHRIADPIMLMNVWQCFPSSPTFLVVPNCTKDYMVL